MALKSAGILRFLLALVCLQFAIACGGNDTPPPEPPPEDTTAPTTRANPAGGAVTAPVSVTLTCEDRGGSGCAATHYTTDGSNPTQSSPRYTSPISLSATTTLKFFSVDAKGNAEEVKTETYTFSGPTDTTPPTVSASPAGGTYGAAQTVTLTCNDGAGSGCASIRFTTDGSTPTTASAQYTAPLTVNANTTLKFFAIDAAGNASAVVTQTYVINAITDTTPPTVAANPAGGVYNATQSVVLTCNDGAGSGCASIHFTTDGSVPTASSPQYSAAITISANTALKFIGIDNAGNTSTVRTESYVIDTVAPTVTANPRGGTYASTRTVTLSCTDLTGCASIRYTTNGSTPTASSTLYTAPISVPANTTLKFIGIDNAGNTSAVVTETYVIDTVAPTVAASPAGGSYNAAQSVTLSCDDGSGSGCASIRYTTNGSTPTASSTQYSAAISISANTTLKFIGIDNAGNTSSVSTETYVIDAVAPTVSANPTGGTYNATQSVVLSCNDGSGSGCASIRYTTDGTTPTANSAAYTLPLSIAADTTLKFIGIDNAGNVSSVVTENYILDTVAPTVAANPTGGTYNAVRSVVLSCDDGAGTGCVSIRYTTDGSAPTASSAEYTAAIDITANTTLKFIGIDNAGNVSTVHTEAYVIDLVAPTVAANPRGNTYNAAVTVTLTCNDGSGSGCASIHYTTDGSVPTSSSPRYTTPLTLSATTELYFIAFDNAGNDSTWFAETYVIDTVAPTTTATPPGGVYGPAQTVSLTCDDSTGSGCMATYYTVDGTPPTTSSPQYSGPIQISAKTTVKFFSVDTAGNTEAVKTHTYFIGTQPSDTSAQISAVQAAAAGTINLPIQLALVTYVKPAVGGDAAGFFLQAEQAGPAIFISVNPGTLNPVPMAGDRVSLVATQKATPSTVGSMTHVTAISGYTVEGRGESVEPFRVDVTMINMSGAAASYESELISVSGTLANAFGASGTGHTSSWLTTLGTTPSNNFVLRLPITLQDQLDLASSCSITAKGPIWRFNTASQTTTYTNDDLTVHSCPAPKVLSAVPTSPTSVTVKFDRRIDPATANSTQFTFNNGLSAVAATPQNRDVVVTTSAQTSGQSYTVTVAPSVRDTRGTPVDSAANTATFLGYGAPATLRITEVSPAITNNRDLVELYVVQGGSVANFTVVQDSSTVLATLPSVQVATGDVIVVHLIPAASNGDAPGSETTSKTQHPAGTYAANYDSAWDFLGGTTGIGFSSRALRVKDALGTTQDAAHFVNNLAPPSSFPAELQALQAEGLWLPANCGGALCTTTSTPTAAQVSAVWTNSGTARTGNTVRRVSATDTDMASDWLVGANSLGLPNP